MILKDYKEQVKGKIYRRIVEFVCDNCKAKIVRSGKRLESRITTRKYQYCTLKCAYEHRGKLLLENGHKITTHRILLKCDMCKKDMLQWKKQVDQFEHHFCSKKCYGEALKAKIVPNNTPPATDEWKRAIGERAKERYKTQPHPMLGKHHSEESKQKISKHHIETGCFSGMNNPMFNKHHTEEMKQKMSELASREIIEGKRILRNSKGFYKRGTYQSTKNTKIMHFRSSWEKSCMQWLDKTEIILNYEYESIRIPYIHTSGNKERGYKRHYIPDFLLIFQDGHKELWEIKPKIYCEKERTKLKAQAARQYCQQNNISLYRILTEVDLRILGILKHQQ